MGMNLGGSVDNVIGSIDKGNTPFDPWSVVVRSARGRLDMRPMKVKLGMSCCAAHQHQGNIDSLERVGTNIMSVDRFQGAWERVPVTVDSGAIDSVMPKKVASGVKIRETAASRQGLTYRAANGTAIKNEGERALEGYTGEGNRANMTMQVAEVTKPLGSVRAMVKAGNMVVFDDGDSYIVNKATGVKTVIEDRNGAFVFDIWVPKGNDEQRQQTNTGYQGKYWQALVEDDQGNEQEGFARLDDLF